MNLGGETPSNPDIFADQNIRAGRLPARRLQLGESLAPPFKGAMRAQSSGCSHFANHDQSRGAGVWAFSRTPPSPGRRQDKSPGGRIDVSPAVHCWVGMGDCISPGGTAERGGDSIVPSGLGISADASPPLKGRASLKSPIREMAVGSLSRFESHTKMSKLDRRQEGRMQPRIRSARSLLATPSRP